MGIRLENSHLLDLEWESADGNPPSHWLRVVGVGLRIWDLGFPVDVVARILSVLRCVPMCCSVSRCVWCIPIAVYKSPAQAGLVYESNLQHTATHCNTLQHTATHCNTLQYESNLPMWGTHKLRSTSCGVLQRVAVCCRVLQCVAVCGRVRYNRNLTV